MPTPKQPNTCTGPSAIWRELIVGTQPNTGWTTSKVSVLCSRSDARNSDGGGDDPDALEARQAEQMGVTRDDEVGLRRQRCGEHLVIGRIARDGRRDGGRRHDGDHGCIAVEHIAYREPAVGQLLGELLARKQPLRSASSAALLSNSMRRPSAASIKHPGVPPHSRPESAVYVSRTSRTPLLGTVGLDLGVDLFGSHRRNGFGQQHGA